MKKVFFRGREQNLDVRDDWTRQFRRGLPFGIPAVPRTYATAVCVNAILLTQVNLRKKKPIARLTRGAVAGAVGGLLGALTMSLSARLTTRLAGRNSNSRPELARLEARRYVNGSSQELDSIGATADWIDRTLGHRLSPGQKGFVAAAVHYGMGAGLGASYGALAERVPNVTFGFGSLFGVAESLAIESVGNSFLGVTRPLREYSMVEHLQSAADHAVYGVTTELMRRNLRKVF